MLQSIGKELNFNIGLNLRVSESLVKYSGSALVQNHDAKTETGSFFFEIFVSFFNPGI